MEPRRQRTFSPEIAESSERPDERVLREVAGERFVAGHSASESKDAVHVTVVELPLRALVTGEYRRDQLGVVQSGLPRTGSWHFGGQLDGGKGWPVREWATGWNCS